MPHVVEIKVEIGYTFLAQQWNDRRIAALAVVLSIAIAGVLYGLAAHFVGE